MLKEELENKIRQARDEYYNSESLIDDATYDTLEEELRLIDPNNELLRKIGADPTSNWPKVKHNIPMGSLDKVQDAGQFINWAMKIVKHGIDLDQPLFCLTEKLDGVSIELQYKKGKLVQAITRGDGIIGEDITPNVLRMGNVQKNLNCQFTGSVRGEIILTLSNFKKFFDGYKNPRNAAAGTAKRLDGEMCQHLTVLVYEVTGSDSETSWPLPSWSYHETMGALIHEFKMKTPNVIGPIPASKVSAVMDEYTSTHRAKLDYEIDGLVVRLNNTKIFESLGDLNMRPRGAIAYKFPPEMKESTINSITWQVGRIGRITPVAEINPIDIGGVTISRVSLHTAKNAISVNAGPGSRVLVSRANDVIPFLQAVIKGKPLSAPSECPSCRQKLTWEGEYLQCDNPTCPSVLLNSIMVWVDRNSVLNWGESLVSSLISNNYVKTLPDIYKIDWKRFGQEFGSGIAERAKSSLNANRSMGMIHFIAALNIRGCVTTSVDVVNAGYNTIDKLINITEENLINIPGIGPTKSKSIYSGIQNLKSIILELTKYITIEEPKMGKLSGKSVCFTGAANRPRKELQKMAEDAGAEVKDSVSKGLTYLVMADPNSTSSKAEKARKLGTKCISEEDFINMVVL